MTEIDIIKLILTNLPTVAIAIGVARIYYKVVTFMDRIEKKINSNTADIEVLIDCHLEHHEEDAMEFRRRNG